MAFHRTIIVDEVPYDDGTPTGRWFRQGQRADSRDPYTNELEWHDVGLAQGPYEGQTAIAEDEHAARRRAYDERPEHGQDNGR